MRRLFVSLYLAVVAAFVLCALAVPWLFEQSLRRPIAEYGARLSAAPQYLFERELGRHPRDSWPEVMRDLQTRFGYELALRPIDSLEVDADVRTRLRAGQALSPPDDRDRMIDMLLPIRGSDLVVVTRFSESDAERAQRGFGGIYSLVERELDTIPAPQRPAELRRLSGIFGIPLTLMTEAEVTDLDAAQRALLRRGQVVGLDMDDDASGERYYKRLDDGSAVLKIGPIPDPDVLDFAGPALFVALAVVLGLISFLWVRPLWRDMRALEQGAATLGGGALDARVEVGQGSAVRPLADTFNAMADRIQGLVTRQRELNNAISHELRTPLARLRFALEMHGRAASDADRARHAASMASDIAELESLVEESLAYSRMNSPVEAPPAPETVRLAPWLEQLVAANRDLAGAIDVRIEVDPLHPEGRFDRRLMTRAVQNLLRNALRHARQRVTLRATRSELIVDDDGPGIPPGQREAVFLPFHRIDDSRSRDTGGHGLGLAIARRIVEQHGGSLVAEESPDGGARFRIEGTGLSWDARRSA